METKVENYPEAQVDAKVQQLVSSGSQTITCTKQGDGRWTIVAVDG